MKCFVKCKWLRDELNKWSTHFAEQSLSDCLICAHVPHIVSYCRVLSLKAWLWYLSQLNDENYKWCTFSWPYCPSLHQFRFVETFYEILKMWTFLYLCYHICEDKPLHLCNPLILSDTIHGLYPLIAR